ncbi:cytochrome P450 [Nocardia sp. NPDC057663]|uniref:cytochrome P450 n=1 Tax=Nocardia sp. NPDC057663 TaxID=3346201 RepID=UPI00366B8F4F
MLADGPRGCIGHRFAMLEACLALALLVRDFEFTAQPGDFPVTTDIVLHSVAPVLCHRTTRAFPH